MNIAFLTIVSVLIIAFILVLVSLLASKLLVLEERLTKLEKVCEINIKKESNS